MHDVISFTRGVPATESFAIEKIQKCAQEVLRQDGDCLLQYGKGGGYQPLREWIAGQYGVSTDQVLIGQGSLQLLDMLVRVYLKPSDHVFLEQPTYDRVLNIFRRSGVGLQGIFLKNGLLDFADFESKLQNGIVPEFFYLIPDFQNPSGAVMPLNDRKRLIELAKSYHFHIIEDGPYRELRYYGENLPSFFEMAPENVIFMSSFSKLIGPGLRVGFMILPDEMALKVTEFAEDTYINASYLNQAIVLEFINRDWLDENLEDLKTLYRPRLDAILSALAQEFGGNAAWIKPEGGFFVGLNLSGDRKAPDAQIADQAGVALSDSRGFFLANGEQFIRLPFCALTSDQLREGIRRLSRAIFSSTDPDKISLDRNRFYLLVLEHECLVAQDIDLIELVAGEQDGRAILFQFDQVFIDTFPAALIDRVGRFIQQQQGGLFQDGLGDAQSFAHTD